MTEPNWKARGRWLAEKALGWKEVNAFGGSEYWASPNGNEVMLRSRWQPHLVVAQAIVIFEHLKQEHDYWEFAWDRDEWCVRDHTSEGLRSKDWRFLSVAAPTLSEAIALAACEATGYKEA